MLPADLAPEWRARAELFREHAKEGVARAYEKCADAVEEALRERGESSLSLQEASLEGGYSADHLGRLIREGRIPNAGRAGAPRIARGDLPLKATRGVVAVPPERGTCEIANAAIVQSIIERGVG